MADSKENKAFGILEQTEQHAREVIGLREKLRLTEEMLARAQEQLKDTRGP